MGGPGEWSGGAGTGLNCGLGVAGSTARCADAAGAVCRLTVAKGSCAPGDGPSAGAGGGVCSTTGVTVTDVMVAGVCSTVGVAVNDAMGAGVCAPVGVTVTDGIDAGVVFFTKFRRFWGERSLDCRLTPVAGNLFPLLST